MTLTFNEQKLLRFIADAEEKRDVMHSAQDRYIEATLDLDRFEVDEKYRAQEIRGYEPDAGRKAELARLRKELAYRAEQRDATVESWKLANAIASRCEKFARDVLGWSPEPAGTITFAPSLRGIGLESGSVSELSYVRGDESGTAQASGDGTGSVLARGVAGIGNALARVAGIGNAPGSGGEK